MALLMRFEQTSGETHILQDARWESNTAEKRERRKNHRAETPTKRTHASTCDVRTNCKDCN